MKRHYERSKPNVLDEYRKLIKKLDDYENAVHSYEPLFPKVTIIHPMNSWTFWYRDASKSRSDVSWEQSLIKIETVSDVNRLWK